MQATGFTLRQPMIAALLWAAVVPFCLAQQTPTDTRPGSDLTVPNVRGIFIPSVPNAPFSATLQVVSRQKLLDGSVYVLKLINDIARDSRGRTYGEFRRFIAESVDSESPLVTSTIYDPVAGLSTTLDPYALIARQTVMKTAPLPPPETVPSATSDPSVKSEDLGEQTFEGLTLYGARESKGDHVNEFWYSRELSIYVIRKHEDSKWEQTFTVTKLDRSEPEASRFVVPNNYKVTQRTASQVPGKPGVYKVGDGVSPPRVTRSVDPEYTKQARKAKLNGICIVALTVDSNGVPQNVHVVRSLGMGLDEKAVEAVEHYQFSPAMYEGMPVAVEVNIEVNFQIY